MKLTKKLWSEKANKEFHPPPPFQATLCALIQEKEFSTVVSTTELQKTTGTVRFKTLTMKSLFKVVVFLYFHI